MMRKTRDRFPLYLLCFVLFCLAVFYLYRQHGNQLSDTVFFGFDSWEYQSLAVNLVLGEGYQLGGIAPFEVYRFTPDRNRYRAMHYPLDGKPATYYEYFMQGGRYSFYRAPGYPFFLAGIYKISGIHPKTAKVLQVILLALVAGMLPWITEFYWRNLGILTGFLSAGAFLRYFSPAATEITAEPLIVFGLCVWAVCLVSWEKRQTTIRVFLLGVVSGAVVLIKGSNVFIPILFLFYLIFSQKGWRRIALLTTAFCLGVLMLVAPWTIYASSKSGSLVLLSTHQKTLLLDSNNEDSIKDGSWHPNWRKAGANDPHYLYNRLRDTDYSSFRKVLVFFSQSKKDLPKFFLMKLIQAFPVTWNRDVLLSLLGMFCYYVSRIRFRSPEEKVVVFPAIYFVNLVVITLIFYGSTRFSYPFLGFFAVPAIYFGLWISRQIFAAFRTEAAVT